MWIWYFKYKDEKMMKAATKYMKTKLEREITSYKKIMPLIKKLGIPVDGIDKRLDIFCQRGDIDFKKELVVAASVTSNLPVAILTKEQQEELKKGLMVANLVHFQTIPK